jgi:putative transcriptional regulator
MKTQTKKATAGGSAARRTRAMIADALAEADAIASALEAGRPLPRGVRVRTYDIPEPTAYTPDRVRSIRRKFGVAQSFFADLVGVSTVLVKSWEQGKRVPSAMAARMLDTMAADPAAWLMLANVKVPDVPTLRRTANVEVRTPNK